MPDKRIQEILTEISALAVTTRVRELITELGTILAEQAVMLRDNNQDADDRFKTLGAVYRRLRKELREFERRIIERDENTSSRLHQLASRMTRFEMDLSELVEAYQNTHDDISRQRIVGDELDAFDDDEPSEPTTIGGSSAQ